MSDKPAVGGAPRRRQRRKDARAGEIIEAALDLFTERGFGATKMEDVARAAGVAKGTLFVYFSTKEDLFRAVARHLLALNLASPLQAMARADRPVAELVTALLASLASVGGTRVPAIIRLLIAESRMFPDLPRLWHEEIVSKALAQVTAVIERAQSRGEIRPGDPRLYAFSIVSPMLAGMIFREVFTDAAASLPDLRALAAQHAEAILDGLRVEAA